MVWNTKSLTHGLNHLLVRLLTHSLICSFAWSQTHSLTKSLACWLSHSPARSLTHLVSCSPLIHSIYLSIDQSINSDCLINSLLQPLLTIKAASYPTTHLVFHSARQLFTVPTTDLLHWWWCWWLMFYAHLCARDRLNGLSDLQR